MVEAWELAAFVFLAAALYSSVGHAGASGYLAAMAIVGLAPETMRPTALALNILVATIATARYARAGQFDWRTLWPFALASVPAAFLGGVLHLPTTLYRPLVGVILLLAALELVRSARRSAAREADAPRSDVPVVPALLIGAGIGLLSGLTGTGGGIFLSPVLLFLGWAQTRKTSGVSKSSARSSLSIQMYRDSAISLKTSRRISLCNSSGRATATTLTSSPGAPG